MIIMIVIIIVSLAVLALYGHREAERFDYNLKLRNQGGRQTHLLRPQLG